MKTADSRARMHPKFCAEGKECLSFLGTCPGVDWSPVYKLRTLLLQVQALMCDNPFKFEPVYWDKQWMEAHSEDYVEMVKYEVINVYIYSLWNFFELSSDVIVMPHACAHVNRKSFLLSAIKIKGRHCEGAGQNAGRVSAFSATDRGNAD